MRSRYLESDARAAVARYGSDPILALRTYTARLLGSDPSLVLHGGGNTSAKGTARDLFGATVPVLFIKGSGWDLATIEPAGHPAVRIEPLLRLRALASLSDEAMVNELRLALLDASAPTPSVETLLHAFLPHAFVDHTHADAVLAVVDQADAAARCREIYGDEAAFVPYVMPGFELAKRTADAYDAAVLAGRSPTIVVLERHGIFTFGATAEESYERMIAAVSRAEAYVAARGARTAAPIVTPVAPSDAAAAAVLPAIRGALAKASGAARGPVLVVRRSPEAVAFLARPDARALVATGCATPDHVIRTKPTACFLGEAADAAAIGPSILAYARDYDAYFDACGGAAKGKTRLDPWPTVIVVPGIGIVASGETHTAASATADVYEHTIRVMADAASIGAYSPVSRADLFDLEYWSLEQAKIKKTAPSPLSRAIAVVTGGASGIGLATAARFLADGAHVAILDRDEEALDAAGIALRKGSRNLVGAFACDVTESASVADAFRRVVLAAGGVDVVVSNAGVASEGGLDDAAGIDKLRASLEVNLLGHANVAAEATAILRAQGTGGALLFNASKAAFAPGPGFGPYAVAKGALVALVRQYAIDLAPFGITSNAVNADRIRTGLFGNGFAESRAAARGLTVDAYFRANLLAREVTADDVADAFRYLATARSTTGAVIPVDGGNPAAFPR